MFLCAELVLSQLGPWKATSGMLGLLSPQGWRHSAFLGFQGSSSGEVGRVGICSPRGWAQSHRPRHPQPLIRFLRRKHGRHLAPEREAE